MSFLEVLKQQFAATVEITKAVATNAPATATATAKAAATTTTQTATRIGGGIWGLVRGFATYVRGLVRAIPRNFGVLLLVNEVMDQVENEMLRFRWKRNLKEAQEAMEKYPKGSAPYIAAKAQIDVFTRALKRRSFMQWLKDAPQTIVRKLGRAVTMLAGWTYGAVTAPLWIASWAFYGVWMFGVKMPYHALMASTGGKEPSIGGPFTDRLMKVTAFIHKYTLSAAMKAWNYGANLSPYGLDHEIRTVGYLNAEKHYSIKNAEKAYKAGVRTVKEASHRDRVVIYTEAMQNRDKLNDEFLNGLRDGASWFEKDLAAAI